MRIPKTLFLGAPLFLCLTMGATDCQYFSNVTVPSADTTAPDVWDAVWTNDAYSDSAGYGNTFTRHVHLGQQYLILGAGIDSGGMKKVTITPETGWTCCQGSTCSGTSSVMSPIISTQAGAVGSSVSDGVYTGREVELDSTGGLCSPGYSLSGWYFKWHTTAEDFHGNTHSGATQWLVFP